MLPLNSTYTADQNLVFNPYHWLQYTNLLFIDSPAGVGYSINNDPTYVFNDKNTVKDNLDVLVDFFTNKFPEYLANPFYLSGESYAGKYIPDLAKAIYSNNLISDLKINLKGLLIGNPAMTFKSGSL